MRADWSPQSLQTRLLARISPEPNTGCWLWDGPVNTGGYGQMYDGGGKEGIHRLAWELFRGPIPPGKQVLHRCDVPCCGNPDHLFLGTRSDNIIDAYQKGRRSATQFSRGEQHERCKLSTTAVLDIRQRRAAGERPIVLAREYGVTIGQIWNIVNRLSWKHV